MSRDPQFQPLEFLTPEMRRRGLVAAMGCTAASALGLGGLLPLLSITLERMTVPGFLIGLNAAMPFLSAMIMMPFVPYLMATIRTSRLLLAMALLSTCSTLSYGLFENVWIWFPIRFVNGIALGVLFAISEAWINHFAEEKSRGRMIALYVTCLSGCFALGPLILLVAGTSGILPFALCAAMIFLASLPILGAWHLPEGFRKDDNQSDSSSSSGLTRFLFIMPTLCLAGIIFGGVEVNVITFIPVYSLRLGFDEMMAAITLTAFSLGNICCQIPIGMLADRFDRRKIMLTCTFIAAASMAALFALFSLFDASSFVVLSVFFVLLFVFGATSVAIYTMAMVQIGERFKGAELASANAVLLFCYNLGSLAMPAITGGLMDFAPRTGLPLLLTMLCLSLFLPTLGRRLFNRQANPVSP